MPQVPYQPYPTVEPQNVPSPPVRVNVVPSAFGTNIAGAVEHLGGTIGQVGNELWSRAVAMKELANETEALNAGSGQELESGKSREKYNSLQGMNAKNGFDAQIQEQNDIRQKWRDSLSNPAAQRLYDRFSNRVFNQAIIAGASHSASEGRKANTNALNTAIDAKINSSRGLSDDDFIENLSDINALSRQISNDAGHDQASASDQAYKFRSKAWSTKIMAEADENPPKAMDMLNRALSNNFLHTADRERVINHVRTQLLNTTARFESRQILDEPNNLEGFFHKRFPGANVQGMNPDFLRRAYTAISDYENQTGQTVNIPGAYVAKRTSAQQAELYDKAPGTGGLAAAPGTSRHEFGEALDIPRGPLLDFLHENAGKYGLEFLKGAAFTRDPVHMQLARGANGEAPDKYEIPERHYLDRAKARATDLTKDDPIFAPQLTDTLVQRTQSDYRQERSQKHDENQLNYNTVLESIVRNPGAPIERILAESPDAKRAYEALATEDPRHVQAINAAIGRANRTETPEQRAEYDRLNGMAYNRNQIGQFNQEDIRNNNKLSIIGQNKLMTLQAKRKGQAADADDARIQHAMTVIKATGMVNDFRTDNDKMNRVSGAMMGWILDYEKVHAGKYPGDSEIVEQARNILLTPSVSAPKTLEEISQQRHPGRIGWDPLDVMKYFFQSRTEPSLLDRDIPPLEEEEIKAKLAAGGLTPTDMLVRQAWIGRELRKLKEKQGQ